MVRIKGLIETMKDYIESFEVVKELNENFDGKYALKTHAVAKVIC